MCIQTDATLSLGPTGNTFPERARLRDRRASATARVEWEGQVFHVTAGFTELGKVGEIFIEGPKVGTAMWRMLQDECVLVSVAMQFGVSAEYLLERVGRNGFRRDAGPASIIGLALRAAVELQASHGPDFAWVSAVLMKVRAP
jgi:hypothetical protein